MKKWIIIIVIVVLVLGVWLFKNNEQETNEITLDKNNQEIDIYKEFSFLVEDELDLDKLKEYNIPIIIDFGADYCPPCLEMKPILKELNEELQGKAIIRMVDTMKQSEIASEYDLMYIPTQIFITSEGKAYANSKYGIEIVKDKDGKEVYSKHVGILYKDELLEILREMGLNE